MPLQMMIAEQGPGRDGGHASMQAVEAERAVQEIGGRLARTADAAEFHEHFPVRRSFRTAR